MVQQQNQIQQPQYNHQGYQQPMQQQPPQQIQKEDPVKNGINTIKRMLNAETVVKQFKDILGKNASGFMTSILSACQNNNLLATADPKSIILAASSAAVIKLPINPNLGYAALIPYEEFGKKLCQMQIMRNGWVELVLRTGKVEKIVNELVYEGELVKKNRFKDEYEFDESKRVSNRVVGAMAYIKAGSLEKTVFWTAEECLAHAKRYSKVYNKGKGLWIKNPEAMMLKTVLKNLIVKYAPKSEELESAIRNDQAAFDGDVDNLKSIRPLYVDNPQFTENDEVGETVDFEEVDAERDETVREEQKEESVSDGSLFDE